MSLGCSLSVAPAPLLERLVRSLAGTAPGQALQCVSPSSDSSDLGTDTRGVSTVASPAQKRENFSDLRAGRGRGLGAAAGVVGSELAVGSPQVSDSTKTSKTDAMHLLFF